MASYHWAKIWFDILDDWKIAPLPDHLWRRFVEFCLIARKLDENGFLPSAERIGWILRDHPEQVKKDLQELEAATKTSHNPGVVQQKDGKWYVTNLMKRQATMSDTERKQRQRQRDKEMSRTGHEDVTEASRGCPQMQEGREQMQDARGQMQAAAEDGLAAAIRAGEEIGFSHEKALELLGEYGAETLTWNIEHVTKQRNVDSPTGLVIARLKEGNKPPSRASPKTQREALAGGQYEGIIET